MRAFSKLFAAGSLFAVLACLSSPVHAAKYKIHWLLGHPNLDLFEEAAANFKTNVEAKSRGDIEIDIVTTSDNKAASGPEPEIAAAVAKGSAEMGHSFVDVMGAVDPRLYAFEAPYLFRDYRHLEGVFEGPLGSQLLADLRTHHLVGLSFTYSGGANGVATRDRRLERPEDLKGLRVGVFGDPVDEAWLKDLGAVPVRVTHNLGSLLPLARNSELDAVVTTWRNFERARLDEEFSFVNMAGSSYLVSVTYVNDKFYDALPEEYRTLIMDESRKLGRIERAKTIELNETSKRAMLARGVSPIHLNARNKKAFLRAVAPSYAKTIEGVVGKGLLEAIRKTADGPSFPMKDSDLARR